MGKTPLFLMKNRNHARGMIVEGVLMMERTLLFLMNHRNHAREMIVEGVLMTIRKTPLFLMKKRNHAREMIVEGAKTLFTKLLMKSKRTNHSMQLRSTVVKFIG